MTETTARPLGANGGALPDQTPGTIGEDLMRGADEIRVFLFGETAQDKQAEADTRAVYHLATKGELGLFKLGGVLCGRKSTILAAIEHKERSAAAKASGQARAA